MNSILLDISVAAAVIFIIRLTCINFIHWWQNETISQLIDKLIDKKLICSYFNNQLIVSNIVPSFSTVMFCCFSSPYVMVNGPLVT